MGHSHGIIFDIDGVLVDSYQAHLDSWRRLALEQNWALTEEQFQATFGRTNADVISLLWDPAGRLSADRVVALGNRKESLYRDLLRREFPAMPGAEALLVDISRAGYGLAVGSSGPPENVRLVLDYVDPQGLISSIVTGDDVARGKPDPEVFQLAAQGLKLPAARCLVVEDAAAGVVAAKAAGMRCVGLASTGRTRAELALADLVVSDLRELSVGRLENLWGLPAAG